MSDQSNKPLSSVDIGGQRNSGYIWLAYSAFFFIDPKNDLFAICMMQSPSQRQRIQKELKVLIYQALKK